MTKLEEVYRPVWGPYWRWIVAAHLIVITGAVVALGFLGLAVA